MIITFTGVQINIEAKSAEAAYTLLCDTLARVEAIDWDTTNSQFETSEGETGDTEECWNRGDE